MPLDWLLSRNLKPRKLISRAFSDIPRQLALTKIIHHMVCAACIVKFNGKYHLHFFNLPSSKFEFSSSCVYEQKAHVLRWYKYITGDTHSEQSKVSTRARGFWVYILCASKFSFLISSVTRATSPCVKVVGSLKMVMTYKLHCLGGLCLPIFARPK